MTTAPPTAEPAARLVSSVLDSPVGALLATVSDRGLARLAHAGDLDTEPGDASHPTLATLADELDRYFAGEPLTFSTPVDLDGLPPFTRTVLCSCAAIRYGATTTYGELARTVGRAGAARAVGNALGANPVPIVVPCHRVVRGDGSLGGYRTGPDRKRFLLALERGG